MTPPIRWSRKSGFALKSSHGSLPSTDNSLSRINIVSRRRLRNRAGHGPQPNRSALGFPYPQQVGSRQCMPNAIQNKPLGLAHWTTGFALLGQMRSAEQVRDVGPWNLNKFSSVASPAAARTPSDRGRVARGIVTIDELRDLVVVDRRPSCSLSSPDGACLWTVFEINQRRKAKL